jgi:hypothetical protein
MVEDKIRHDKTGLLPADDAFLWTGPFRQGHDALVVTVPTYAWPRVKADGHAADVLARLGSAKADRAARSSAG